MGIYIKGMEMPKSKEIVLRIDEKGEVYVYGTYPTELHEAVPVVPHGRLIDADELFKEMERKGWFDNADRDEAKNLVLDAPTILEAEEGE